MTAPAFIEESSDSIRWRRYLKYKPSGVEWLGDVPIDWIVLTTKRLFNVVNGSTPKSTEMEYWEGDIPWVTPEDLGKSKQDTIFDSQRIITSKGYMSCGTSLVPEGSLIISTRAPIGYIKIANREMCTNQGCKSLVFKISQEDRDRKFFYYLYYTCKPELESWGQGATFKELANSKLENILIVKPPLPEQHAIAAFLDRETARIDDLIAKKERQIELRQEKRSALISQAVTKGLDPNAKMKDSGIEWLGMVPEHWDLVSIRGLLVQRYEFNIGPKTENILSVVRNVGVINYEERSAAGNKKSENIEQYKIIYPGDIVLNRMNIIIGSVGISKEYGAASIEYYVLYPRDGSIDKNYYANLFCSKEFQESLKGIGTGILAHRLRISYDDLKKVKLPRPPKNEQCQISAYLDIENGHSNKLIMKIQESLDKLHEYRSAIISAAVIGKIDIQQDVLA